MKQQGLTQDEIAALFAASSGEQKDDAQPAVFPSLAQAVAQSVDPSALGLLADVELELSVELGQTRRNIREILTMGPGSVLDLDKHAGETVDILVNGRLVARGEVVVIGENFGVRIAELVNPEGGTDR